MARFSLLAQVELSPKDRATVQAAQASLARQEARDRLERSKAVRYAKTRSGRDRRRSMGRA